MDRAEELESQLSMIEFEGGHLLDDESLKFLAALRARNVLTEEEWARIKSFLRSALEFLTAAQKQKGEGPGTLEDPRNADWIRIVGVCQRTGVGLPNWAALWIWWLRSNAPNAFWRRVGRIGQEMGFRGQQRTANDQEIKPPPSLVILHRLREGEPSLGELSSSEERWLRAAFTHLRRIDYWRRKHDSKAYCIFEFGPVYFQCLAPLRGRYLRCEVAPEKNVPELLTILTRENREKLVAGLGFLPPRVSKNFSRKIEIGGQKDLAFVARLAFRVLRDAYGITDFGSGRFKRAPSQA